VLLPLGRTSAQGTAAAKCPAHTWVCCYCCLNLHAQTPVVQKHQVQLGSLQICLVVADMLMTFQQYNLNDRDNAAAMKHSAHELTLAQWLEQMSRVRARKADWQWHDSKAAASLSAATIQWKLTVSSFRNMSNAP